METLFLIVPIALVFVFIAVRVLFWAINSGQYDDLETEAHKILFDEKITPRHNQPDNPDRADNAAGDDTKGTD